MNKVHMSVVIIFSIVVLEYNLSAFIEPFSFESISEAESTGWIRKQDAGSDNKMMLEEVQDFVSLRLIDSGYVVRDLNVFGRI